MTKILAIDAGTSSVRALIFSEVGEVLHVSQTSLGLSYPQNGWVEQDPQEIIEKIFFVIRDVLSQVDDPRDIAAAGLTNQRETVVMWNKHDGRPVYNAIVWQDRRTSDLCDALKRDGVEDEVRQKTGLLLDPYFSATKIKWILDHVDSARALAERGDLLFGTVDSYIMWHLTSGDVHATDVTNASRTLLYDIRKLSWDEELLRLFDIPESVLPDVRDNTDSFGYIDGSLSSVSIHISGVAGDQQSALIGQACIRPGMVKSTYGTGCFLLMNTGEDALVSEHRLLSTIGFRVRGEISYALEGAIFNAGTAIQFLRDNLGFLEDVADSNMLAGSIDDNGGVYFVPAFTGLGAPFWQADARGMIYGLTRDTRPEHIVRAALEAQAYQTRDLLDVMCADSGQVLDGMRIDGGLVANDFVCQFLADVLRVSIDVPSVHEATAWGVACLAGVQQGVFDDLKHAASLWQLGRTYSTKMEQDRADHYYQNWRKAVTKA